MGALTAGWRGRSGARGTASAVGPTLPKGAGLEAAACSERVSKARLVSGQDLVPGLGFPLVRVTRAGGFPSLLPVHGAWLGAVGLGAQDTDPSTPPLSAAA